MDFGDICGITAVLIGVYIIWYLHNRRKLILIHAIIRQMSETALKHFMTDLTLQECELIDWTCDECVEAIEDHLDLYPHHIAKAYKMATEYLSLTDPENNV